MLKPLDLVEQRLIFVNDCQVGEWEFGFHFGLIALLAAEQNDALHSSDGLLEERLNHGFIRCRVVAEMNGLCRTRRLR